MRLTNSFAMFFSMIFSMTAFGGIRIIGSGGDILRCEDKGVVTHEVFDLFEGRNSTDFQASFSDLKGNAFDRAKTLVKRLDGHGPLLSALLVKYVDRVQKGLEFIDVEEMEDVPDSYHSFIPKQGCRMVQVAVQSVPWPESESQRTYYIAKSTWDLIDENQRASLILHEAAFSLFLDYNKGTPPKEGDLEKNSSSVREFVWLLASGRIRSLSTVEYLRFLLYNGMEFFGEFPAGRTTPIEGDAEKKTTADLQPTFFLLYNHLTFEYWTSEPRHYKLVFSRSGELAQLSLDPIQVLKVNRRNGLQDPPLGQKEPADREKIFAVIPESPTTEMAPRVGFLTSQYRPFFRYYEALRTAMAAHYCSGKPVFEGLAESTETDSVKIAEALLGRLSRFSRLQARMYQDTLKEVVASIRWKSGLKFLSMGHGSEGSTESCEKKYVFSIVGDYFRDDEGLEGPKKTVMMARRILGDADLWRELSPNQQGFLLTQMVLLHHLVPDGRADSGAAFWDRRPLMARGQGEAYFKVDPDLRSQVWTKILASSRFETVTDAQYVREMIRWSLPFFWSRVSFDFVPRNNDRLARDKELNEKGLVVEELFKSSGLRFDEKGRLMEWRGVKKNWFGQGDMPEDLLSRQRRVYGNYVDTRLDFWLPARIVRSQKDPSVLLGDWDEAGRQCLLIEPSAVKLSNSNLAKGVYACEAYY